MIYFSVIKKYPNLILTTYANLTTGNDREKLINDKYDFLITDELHLTGAKETRPILERLYKKQDQTCKILGITATPIRDCDGIDMAQYWAEYFGYIKEEIIQNKHLAYNMDVNQAIQAGYLANPKVVNCEYNLLNESGEIDELLKLLNEVTDEEERKKLLEKYNKLRRELLNSKSVDEILRDNVSDGDCVIVFCPVKGNELENGKTIYGQDVLDYYIEKLKGIYGEENVEYYSMIGGKSKKNSISLELFKSKNPKKKKFMVVMDKFNLGIHIKSNKMIWFRALDKNSYALCNQQMGRIMRSLKPGEVLSEEEIPIIVVKNLENQQNQMIYQDLN